MAVTKAFAQDALDRAEPLTVAAAYAQCRAAALAESVIGAVGLEMESHLVDLDHVADPVPWKRIEAIAAVVGEVAPGSAVTVEPGGQIELSGPPEAGVAPAVARLRSEGTGARLALADRRLGLAYAGADPARPSRRVNPRPRYRAMEQHFAATGRAAAGQVMMNSTAALQVNLQAGPRGEWPARVARAYRLRGAGGADRVEGVGPALPAPVLPVRPAGPRRPGRRLR
jgi:glutamate--cysteine ligase